MSAPTRVIASLGVGPHEALLRLAAATIEPYARRHGYALELHTGVVDATRPAPWSKVRILRDLVDRHEIVVWLDADLEIVDPRVDIASELDPGSFLGIVEHRYRASQFPNSGVMVLRGGERAAGFLDEVWALDAYIDHTWWENAAICELLGYGLDPPRRLATTAWRDQTTFLSPSWNWIVNAPLHRARIRHFPGFALRTRTILMRAALVEARARSLVWR